MKFFAIASVFFGCFLLVFGKNCHIENTLSGQIFDGTSRGGYEKCWMILVPAGKFIHLNIIDIHSQRTCDKAYLKISVMETPEQYILCSKDRNKNPIIALKNVTISHITLHSVWYDENISPSFNLSFNIKDLECISKDHFKCNENSCITRSKVCDGRKDCENGADEIGCETGILAVKGITEARQKAISWLKKKRSSSWGWRDYTSRAVVALYLASDANFNGTILEEELMAKQVELKTAVVLLRSSLTNSELSMFINSLLVTCHNPRKFYGINLVTRLKVQVKESKSFTHPLSYLALCNAQESWPQKAISDLNNILNSTSNYSFVEDLQAMAIIAISCNVNNTEDVGKLFLSETLTLYENTVNHFMEVQLQDGSFGNVYTTALITQALISSGHEHSKSWNLNAAIKYLMNHLNSTSTDFLSTYLTLPLLNGKTLMDVSTVNCSANPRKHGDDPVSELNDYLGPKMHVQFSLYIGDEKDVIHTIALRVPENYTAAEIMELAEVEDPKYKFKWKTMSGKMYVYDIANIANDPEMGKFWLLYVGKTNNTESLIHLTTSPDELMLENGEHLIFWYKTASI
ncbi:hypothetical protein CDAR_605583 [Caerostris darwini]|uniref:Uncharacterized protein n=1 Tax=Caerostris darwini TaxID=1538125 RepID=A0AAV4TM58_9ARAC|nr:hypothetical protein CDAR_605583 [Caerostris darwini]